MNFWDGQRQYVTVTARWTYIQYMRTTEYMTFKKRKCFTKKKVRHSWLLSIYLLKELLCALNMMIKNYIWVGRIRLGEYIIQYLWYWDSNQTKLWIKTQNQLYQFALKWANPSFIQSREMNPLEKKKAYRNWKQKKCSYSQNSFKDNAAHCFSASKWKQVPRHPQNYFR